jgi:hypothetical protein
MWTRFMDMHSGGGQKEKWAYIYIEAPQSEAELIFYNRFGHNPNRVTCTCCGDDYAISEGETLAEVSAYDRGCGYENGAWVERTSIEKWAKPYQTVEEFVKDDDFLFIYAADVKPEWRTGELPEQGYIWHD